MRHINEIDKIGGALKAIEKGYIQREIMDSAYNYQKAVDSGDQVIVGVNEFVAGEGHLPEILEIGLEIEQKQTERLRRLKRERNGQKVNDILSEVHRVASSDQNMMAVLIEAVEAYATVGEISDAMRDVFGEYREPSIF